jgi:hypothetical protein
MKNFAGGLKKLASIVCPPVPFLFLTRIWIELSLRPYFLAFVFFFCILLPAAMDGRTPAAAGVPQKCEQHFWGGLCMDA